MLLIRRKEELQFSEFKTGTGTLPVPSGASPGFETPLTQCGSEASRSAASRVLHFCRAVCSSDFIL